MVQLSGDMGHSEGSSVGSWPDSLEHITIFSFFPVMQKVTLQLCTSAQNLVTELSENYFWSYLMSRGGLMWGSEYPKTARTTYCWLLSSEDWIDLAGRILDNSRSYRNLCQIENLRKIQWPAYEDSRHWPIGYLTLGLSHDVHPSESFNTVSIGALCYGWKKEGWRLNNLIAATKKLVSKPEVKYSRLYSQLTEAHSTFWSWASFFRCRGGIPKHSSPNSHCPSVQQQPA